MLRAAALNEFALRGVPGTYMGSHLARRELRIAIELRLPHLPPLYLESDKAVRVQAAGVFGVDDLHLAWNAA